ncbi:hypothetical protein PG990_009418 [Apiospora arundinis]
MSPKQPSKKQLNAEAKVAPPPPEPPMPSTITEEPAPSTPAQSITWNDMRRAKMHPLPESADLEIKSYLGQGIEGIVFKGKIHNDTHVAIKVPLRRRLDGGTAEMPWPFQEECRNAALLQNLRQGMEIVADHGRRVRVKTKPEDAGEMKQNILAFCTEPSSSSSSSSTRAESSEDDGGGGEYTTLTEFPPLPRCYGWARIERETLETFPEFGRDAYAGSEVDFRYALIYDYMSEGRSPRSSAIRDIMQKQLNFFYLTGFNIEPYKEDNWRGGVLVDMNDLASLFGPWWDEGYVARYDVIKYLGDEA